MAQHKLLLNKQQRQQDEDFIVGFQAMIELRKQQELEKRDKSQYPSISQFRQDWGERRRQELLEREKRRNLQFEE